MSRLMLTQVSRGAFRGVVVISLILCSMAFHGGSSIAASTHKRGLWYAIGDKPTTAEVEAAPSKFGVVVLNPWEVWALQRIKTIDPTVRVFMYKDLSSSRKYADAFTFAKPTGVGYGEAEATDPSWFAKDTAGNRIQWAGYPDHWQMSIWSPTYQQRWTRNVVREAVDVGWDGVLADNDLPTLGYYSKAFLAGTSSAAQTDAKLRAGYDALITMAGDAMLANGKLLVPNVGDARLYPTRWQSHSRFGGAMEEQFAHWGTDSTSGFVWDWGSTGWLAQTSEMSGAGLSLAITHATSSDRRTRLYGYTSLLVRGDDNAYWQPSSGTYGSPESMPEVSWFIGTPRTSGTRLSTGAWTRIYDGAFIAVNPTMSTIRITVPSTFVTSAGQVVTTVTIGPTTGIMFKRG
jgi:hypothetical protein